MYELRRGLLLVKYWLHIQKENVIIWRASGLKTELLIPMNMLFLIVASHYLCCICSWRRPLWQAILQKLWLCYLMLPYRCDYQQNSWPPSFMLAFLDSLLHTATSVFFLQCTSDLFTTLLESPHWHWLTHGMNSEVQTLASTILCDLAPQLPLQPFSYCSASFSFVTITWASFMFYGHATLRTPLESLQLLFNLHGILFPLLAPWLAESLPSGFFSTTSIMPPKITYLHLFTLALPWLYLSS